MSLLISSFAGRGEPMNERIIFRALTEVDIGDYIVLRSSLGPDGVSATAGSKQAYWFPDEIVKANDLVILYTKEGVPKTKKIDEQRTAYFYYWRSKIPLWNNANFGAVLVKADTWEVLSPPEEEVISE
jgi:hypothetical protein